MATGFAGSLTPRAALNGKHGRGHPPWAPTPMLNRQRHAHLPSEPRHPAPAGTLGYKLGESAAHVPSGAKASSASWYPCPPARGKCKGSQSCACECGMAVRAPTEAAIPRGAQTQTRMARGIITWHRNTSHWMTRRWAPAGYPQTPPELDDCPLPSGVNDGLNQWTCFTRKA